VSDQFVIEEVPIKKYSQWASGIKKRKQKNRPGFAVPLKFKKIKSNNRLAFLISHLKLDKPDVPLLDMVCKRRGFNYTKGYQFPLNRSIKCYLCAGEATLRHHVVPLAKGGRNRRNNIVPLCHKCHCKVHPHMQKGYKKVKRERVEKPIYRPALCKPKQQIVVIPPKIVEINTIS
jgi:5-methylcytosine-specific restriction endonuclease McrA